MKKRFALKCLSLAVATMAISTVSFAQDWKPNRPITVIVPWAAGGSPAGSRCWPGR
jgi:tripartite-type tricarboxylate transporter receptor subunit TctC